MTHEQFNPDSCFICGGDHLTESCHIWGETTNPNPNVSLAQLSLPHQLSVHRHESNKTTDVYCNKSLAAKTQFGPFEAKRTTQILDDSNTFVLKVFNTDGSSVTLETGDESSCNWLCLVAAAQSEAEQNCIALQVGGNVYFCLLRDMMPGVVLKVWYEPGYAGKLGKPLTPDGRTVTSLHKMQRSATVLNSQGRGGGQQRRQSTIEIEAKTQETPIIASRQMHSIGPPSGGMIATPSPGGMIATPPPGGMVSRAPSRGMVASASTGVTAQSVGMVVTTSAPMGTFGSPSVGVSTPSHGSVVQSPAGNVGSLSTGRIVAMLKDGTVTMAPAGIAPTMAGAGILRAAIPTKERFICGRCAKEFNTKTSLGHHQRACVALSVDMRTVKKRTWTCKHCYVVFSNPRSLGSHYKQHHSASSGDKHNGDAKRVSGGTECTTAATEEATVEAPCSTSDVVTRFPRKRKLPQRYNSDGSAGLHVDTYIQCVHCGEEFDTQKEYKEHLLTDHTPQCTACKEVFSSLLYLTKHVCVPAGLNAAAHRHGDTFSCPKCPRGDISTVKEMEWHLAAHIGHRVCTVCGKEFLSAEDQDDHLLTCCASTDQDDDDGVHRTRLSCPECQRSVIGSYSLLQHMAQCCPKTVQRLYPQVAVCDVCSAVLPSRSEMRTHCLSHPDAFCCKECFLIFSTKAAFESHDCAVKSLFICTQCGKAFPSEQKLAKHTLTHNSATFSCDICRATFNKKEALILHSWQCAGKKMLQTDGLIKCPRCTEQFTNLENYTEHLRKHSHPFPCTKCGQRFIRKASCVIHEKDCDGQKPEAMVDETFTDGAVDCSVCGKTFRNTRNLERHMSLHKEPQFSCEFCGKKVYRKDYLLKHVCDDPASNEERLRTLHERGQKAGDEPPKEHICDVCGKIYTDKGNLIKHIETHGDKEFVCKVCGKLFFHRHTLKQHLESVHTTLPSQPCKTCNKLFKTANTLKQHIKQFHSADSHEFRFSCDICRKRFRQRGNMKKHHLIHGPGKMFACSICPKKFKYPEQKRRHELVHKQGKAHACNLCTRKFVLPFELKKHIREFHSTNVYVCPFCGEPCRWKHTITRHITKKHASFASSLKAKGYLDTLIRDRADVAKVGGITAVQGGKPAPATESTQPIIVLDETNPNMQGQPTTTVFIREDQLTSDTVEALRNLTENAVMQPTEMDTSNQTLWDQECAAAAAAAAIDGRHRADDPAESETAESESTRDGASASSMSLQDSVHQEEDMEFSGRMTLRQEDLLRSVALKEHAVDSNLQLTSVGNQAIANNPFMDQDNHLDQYHVPPSVSQSQPMTGVEELQHGEVVSQTDQSQMMDYHGSLSISTNENLPGSIIAIPERSGPLPFNMSSLNMQYLLGLSKEQSLHGGNPAVSSDHLETSSRAVTLGTVAAPSYTEMQPAGPMVSGVNTFGGSLTASCLPQDMPTLQQSMSSLHRSTPQATPTLHRSTSSFPLATPTLHPSTSSFSQVTPTLRRSTPQATTTLHRSTSSFPQATPTLHQSTPQATPTLHRSTSSFPQATPNLHQATPRRQVQAAGTQTLEVGGAATPMILTQNVIQAALSNILSVSHPNSTTPIVLTEEQLRPIIRRLPPMAGTSGTPLGGSETSLADLDHL